MTTQNNKEDFELIMAIYPDSYGFGFALMSSPIKILEKRTVRISPVSNTQAMASIRDIIKKHKPERIILEDVAWKSSRKRARVKQLIRSIMAHAKKKDIPFSSYTREDIQSVFSIWKAKTCYQIAKVIADNIPAMKFLLFDKPKYPKADHYFSSLFNAISLGVTHYYKTT